ncbi:TPA: restriction endonuclease subunit S [Streptococcus suis]
MMSKKSPQLRFEGFTDEWEERKLSTESTITAGGDIDKSKLKEVGEYPILANALTNDGIVGYYDSSYRVEAPAVTVTGRGDVGHAKARKVNFTPVVRLLSVKSKHDVDFLENAINNHKVLVESTGVPQLTAPQLGNYKIFFPTGEEQEKIGSFFKQLDDTIALHQRKLDLLKEQKKGFLQKMFPKNGAKVPELRFAGFADDWEERKLGDVATFLNGRAYKQDELLDSGKYKVLRVGNFYTNDSWYYSNMELGDKYYVDKGDLVYTWSATFGPHIWSGEKVIYHYHIWKVELSKFLDRNFTLQLLEADKARLLSSTNGSTMIHVTKGDMESKIVSIPNIDEQQKIGSFFKQLDDTIDLHQRKLDLLKEQKKGFLQKMFV